MMPIYLIKSLGFYNLQLLGGCNDSMKVSGDTSVIVNLTYQAAAAAAYIIQHNVTLSLYSYIRGGGTRDNLGGPK